jgi:hypothetical protein
MLLWEIAWAARRTAGSVPALLSTHTGLLVHDYSPLQLRVLVTHTQTHGTRRICIYTLRIRTRTSDERGQPGGRS